MGENALVTHVVSMLEGTATLERARASLPLLHAYEPEEGGSIASKRRFVPTASEDRCAAMARAFSAGSTGAASAAEGAGAAKPDAMPLAASCAEMRAAMAAARAAGEASSMGVDAAAGAGAGTDTGAGAFSAGALSAGALSAGALSTGAAGASASAAAGSAAAGTGVDTGVASSAEAAVKPKPWWWRDCCADISS